MAKDGNFTLIFALLSYALGGLARLVCKWVSLIHVSRIRIQNYNSYISLSPALFPYVRIVKNKTICMILFICSHFRPWKLITTQESFDLPPFPESFSTFCWAYFGRWSLEIVRRQTRINPRRQPASGEGPSLHYLEYGITRGSASVERNVFRYQS